MRLQLFLLWIGMTDDKPENISCARWNAMLKWYDARERLREPFTYGD